MAEQPPPPSGQPPPSYQPPPPSNSNPYIPQSNQGRKNRLSGVNPRIWVGLVIVIVVIAVLLFWSSQQKGADTADRADRIALEQTSTQNAAIFITLTFSASTPTIDPQLAAVQTQNALLAQNLTNQSVTSQVVIAQPTTEGVLIVTATPLPPTAQPPLAPLIITATALPQPTQVVVPTQVPQSGGESGHVTTVDGGGATVCPPATNDDYKTPKIVVVTGRAIVHPWWNNNRPSWGQEQVRLMLSPGETVTLIDMMGRVYTYQNTPACEAMMPQEFANATYRIVTVQDLVSQGLAQTGTVSSQNPVWTQSSFGAQTGTVTLGNATAWVTFQGWDGKNISSVVHGVIEPGWTLTVPAPFQGTMWTVTDITYDAVTARAMEARGEVVARDKLTTNPPLVYVGSQTVPAGYTSALPSQWNSKRG